MDQDIAAQEDGDNFDPSTDARDYEEVAAQLPVFCISSRAYQKLSGRLEKDEKIKGFLGIEDTEIPALKRHALDIVKLSRAAVCRSFLSELYQYLTSLHMHVVISDQPLKLEDDLRSKEVKFLEQSVENLSIVSFIIPTQLRYLG